MKLGRFLRRANSLRILAANAVLRNGIHGKLRETWVDGLRALYANPVWLNESLAFLCVKLADSANLSLRKPGVNFSSVFVRRHQSEKNTCSMDALCGRA